MTPSTATPDTPASVTREIAGFGGFPRQTCRLLRPEKTRECKRILAGAGQRGVISRGLGRSYGDASLNDGGDVALHERLNRFLAFDESTGVVEAEGGVTIAEIIRTFLPRGWFPPVTPGTKHVTLGGAIAANVHGKNHHRDGAISSFVDSFSLLTGAGDVIECSRASNPEAYWATIGGMGLTGMILSARLRLRRVESAFVAVDYEKTRSLDHTLERFTESDQRYAYSVAWIDCLATGAALGRSVLMRGDHAPTDDLPRARRAAPLLAPEHAHASVPFNMPGLTLNALTVGAFNALFYARHRDRREIVDYDAFFYPLDSIAHWGRMYGRRGFVQYQAVLPPETSRKGLLALLESLARSRRPSFLAVLKSFGRGDEGLLSFPHAGHTLALDLPMKGPETVRFLQGLDEVVLDHGGRVYLAKDACLRPESVEAMYPKLASFREIQRKLDPSGRLRSSLARRLRLVSP